MDTGIDRQSRTSMQRESARKRARELASRMEKADHAPSVEDVRELWRAVRIWTCKRHGFRTRHLGTAADQAMIVLENTIDTNIRIISNILLFNTGRMSEVDYSILRAAIISLYLQLQKETTAV